MHGAVDSAALNGMRTARVQAEAVAQLPSFYAEDTPASANELWSRLHSDPLFAVRPGAAPLPCCCESYLCHGILVALNGKCGIVVYILYCAGMRARCAGRRYGSRRLPRGAAWPRTR